MRGSEELADANQKLAEKIGIDLDRLPSKERHAQGIEDMSWPIYNPDVDVEVNDG